MAGAEVAWNGTISLVYSQTVSSYTSRAKVGLVLHRYKIQRTSLLVIAEMECQVNSFLL